MNRTVKKNYPLEGGVGETYQGIPTKIFSGSIRLNRQEEIEFLVILRKERKI